MRTVRSAAEALQAASSLDALHPIAAALGCDGEPVTLAPETAAAVGLPDSFGPAQVARGPGSLRALLVVAPGCGRGTFRDAVDQLASRVATRAPHLLWIVAAVEPHGPRTAILTWSSHRSPPRVAALIVDRNRIVDSDAETLRALAAARGDIDVLVHARWLDILGRDALTRRFYHTLERLVGELAAAARGHASMDERRELALLHASRLLFLSFLEAKGWLDGDHAFLTNGYERCMAGSAANGDGFGYHRRVLRPLFFGTLNTPRSLRAPAARRFGRVPFLNGGLFATTSLERRRRDVIFPDAELGALYGDLLGRYRFTAREDSATWSEAAVDPEMLGRAFESLMASRERRTSGAFYTPHAIVAEVTHAGLTHALGSSPAERENAEAALRGESLVATERDRLAQRLRELRVLDPACGSGAFLVHVLERLAALSRQLGDTRAIDELRRAVLTRSIFGVDINPTAVWLCELRLWLSVVIESSETDPDRIPPLPNLDHHIRVGDSLSGEGFVTNECGLPVTSRGNGSRLTVVRERYARATGARKAQLARVLEREQRASAIARLDAAIASVAARRRDQLAERRSHDLFGERHAPAAADRARLDSLRREARRLRDARRSLANGAALPFSFSAHYADVAAAGGFDLVLGNPPWVRLHNIPPAMRTALRQRYRVFREAAWMEGARGARAGRGFAAQVDLAAMFVERSLQLLAQEAPFALLLPVKLWRSLAGGGLRALLATDAEVRALDDWSESRPAFDAAVYPSMLVGVRRAERAVRQPDIHPHESAPGREYDITVTLRRGDDVIRWPIQGHALGLDESPASPWLLVPHDVRASFDRLRRAGPTLGESGIGQPLLGVKCGCNAAFVVRVAGDGSDGRDTATVRAREREGRVERRLLRPLIRGETLAPWRTPAPDEWMLWTHGADGRALERLPPHAAHWLAPWRRRLSARTDRRDAREWWSLFRTESAASDLPRVVWGDFGRDPRAAVIPAGDPAVALNSCYVARCADVEDARTLAALLNSPLAAAWLNTLAEPARGGYHRYLAWTVALLPLPTDWLRARRLLAPLARRAELDPVSLEPCELLDAAVRAYDVSRSDLTALLTWSER